jgi:hypothetical protein
MTWTSAARLTAIASACTEGYEVRYECDKLECTEAELRAAVEEVGHMRADVEAYLASGKRAD